MAQAVEIRTFSKGMNKDVDPRFLADGEYVDAENIMLSNYKDGRAGSLTNLPGLERLHSVTATTVLGMFKDELNDALYIFSYISSVSKQIYKYNLTTDAISTIESDASFPWTTNTVIKSCRIIEGILIWTDGDNEIGMYDTNITYPSTVDADMLTLAQVVPQKKPDVNPTIALNYGYNNIIGKFFQFKFRFIFESGFKSVFSPISDVAYTVDDYSSPEEVSARNNTVNSIRLTIPHNGSTELVKEIELAARSGNDGDFFSIKKIEATSDFKTGVADMTHVFYNESLYSPIALVESNQIYDDVPKTAQTLEIADNRVILGDCLTGEDKVDVDYDLVVSYGDSVEPSILDATQTNRTSIEDGTPWAGNLANGDDLETYFGTGGGSGFNYDALRVGDSIRCVGFSTGSTWLYSFGDVTVTIEEGDDWGDIVSRLGSPTFEHPYTPGAYLYGLLDTSDGDVGNTGFEFYLSQGQHVKTLKSGAWYNVGLQYFDGYGRTNGVQIKEDAKVYIKTLGERGLAQGSYTGAGAAILNVKIRSAAPSWAVYYKIVYSRANISEFTLQTSTRSAGISGSDNVILDISVIGDWNAAKGGNLAYIWEKGDRIRVLTRDDGAGTVLTDWAEQLIDAEIIGDDSTANYSVIIPSISGLSQADSILALDNGAQIEIYRPSKELDDEDSIFTEASPDYAIGGSNYHNGDVDQTSTSPGGEAEVEITGDAYIKSRTLYPYAASSTANIAFEGYDISDYRESAHYDKGRPTAIINQVETQRVSTLMYSEFIIPNTEINKLNKFYPDDSYEEYSKPFGRIIHLHAEEDHLLMIQEDKTSKVYINRSVMYDGQGNAQVIGTQQSVLSKAVPYAGTYGISDAQSFQAVAGRRYWADPARGVILRLSQNGIEEISRYGMRGWFSSSCRALKVNANQKVYSIYDIQNDQYIVRFDADNKTVIYDEKNNSWVSFVTLYDLKYSTYINNRSIMIDGVEMYEMNYAGVARNSKEDSSTPIGAAVRSYIRFESNVEPAMLKNYFRPRG